MHPIDCKRSNQIKRIQQFCEDGVPFHSHHCFPLSGGGVQNWDGDKGTGTLGRVYGDLRLGDAR